jgi:WD40 repeat protein
MVAWDVRLEYYHDASAVELACPKVASGLGVASSPDGSMVGVLVRSSCKDRVVVYDSGTFEEVGRLELGTSDAAGMLWSPDSTCLAVWDGVTYGPRVVAVGVKSVQGVKGAKGVERTSFELSVLMDKTWHAGTSGLGVRTASWSPSGSVLALGTYDSDVLLVNALTWKGMQTSLHHAAVVDEKRYGGTDIEVVVFEESEAGHYVDASMPARLPTVQDRDDASASALPPLMPTTGVERVLFSSTGKFLATVCPDKPNVLWIWDASRFQLDTVLVHRRPIRDVAWRPGSDSCYLVCGTKSVFVFDDGVMTVLATGVADERFKGMSVRWSKESHQVVVSCGGCYSVGSC